MKPETADLQGLVADSLAELRKDLALPELDGVSSDTDLLGGDSDLDSMAVVHLIADIEGRLAERYGRDWILADERALSRRRSPFRTVGDLCAFIIETTPGK
jgi:acyl carrier protein